MSKSHVPPNYQTTRPIYFFPDLAPAVRTGGMVVCTGVETLRPTGTWVAIAEKRIGGRTLLYAQGADGIQTGWAWVDPDDYQQAPAQLSLF